MPITPKAFTFIDPNVKDESKDALLASEAIKGASEPMKENTEGRNKNRSRWSPRISPTLRRRSPYSSLAKSPNSNFIDHERRVEESNVLTPIAGSGRNMKRGLSESLQMKSSSPSPSRPMASYSTKAEESITPMSDQAVDENNRSFGPESNSSESGGPLSAQKAATIFRQRLHHGDEESDVASDDESMYEESTDENESSQETSGESVGLNKNFNVRGSLLGNQTSHQSHLLDNTQVHTSRNSIRNLSYGPNPSQARREPSQLHDICKNASTWDDLLRAKSLLSEGAGQRRGAQNIASKTDIRNRTPLHLFSGNKGISSALGKANEFDVETKEYRCLFMQPTFDQDSLLEKQVLHFLIGDLLAAYPGAMMIKDDAGQIPFEWALREWVDLCHDRRTTNKEHETTSKYQTNHKFSRVWETTSNKVRSAVRIAGRHIGGGDTNDGSQMKSPKVAPDVEHGDEARTALRSAGPKHIDNRRLGGHLYKKGIPSNVQLSEHIRFTLIMLSAIVEQLDRYMAPESMRKVNNQKRSDFMYDLNADSFDRVMKELRSFREIYGSVDISTTVVETVACIPDLMKTILLISDDDEREFALTTPIVRRIMLSEHTVGSWLTGMLQSKSKRVAEKAVDYLKRVSDMAAEYHLKSSKSRKDQDTTGCDEVIAEISRLQDFIPALLALGDRGVEEASTTLVVKGVLDRMISRPFAVTVVFCDGIFLTLLIIGFRAAVNRLLTGGSLKVVLKYIYVANTGIFYFIIREIGKIVSLCMISKRARLYFLSFWNLIDMMATILSLTATISMRYHFTFLELGLEDTGLLRSLLAITTGFLWLRVLSLLKAINMQLATFVLAIIQITKDILWFCVILFTLVVSFSQMFFTLLAPASCASASAEKQECSQSEYILRTYQVLLGDFGDYEREDFTSEFSVFLVVLYSFLVVVVLLNVLIAVAADSYEKCLVRSQNLFGRARVMLIAELVSFQNLLRSVDSHDDTISSSTRLYSSWWSSRPWIKNWSRGSVLFFSCSLSVVAAWSVGEIIGYASGERHGNVLLSLASIFVNGVLFIAIMSFLASGAAGLSSKKDETENMSARRFTICSCLTNWNEGYIQSFMLRLLGASSSIRNDSRSSSGGIEDWNGRVMYLHREMARIAQESMNRSGEQAKAMESYVAVSESRLRGEITKLEDSFNLLKSSVLEEVKGTKQTNQNVTLAVEELKTLISMAASTSAYQSPVPSLVDVKNGKPAKHGQKISDTAQL